MATALPPGATLTRHQWTGLRSTFNLADGHSRQAQTRTQLDLLQGLPTWFLDSASADQEGVEERFATAFLDLAGQSSALVLPAPSYHYSASVAIAVLAHALAQRDGPVGVMHPTFDNIPALLQRHRVPIEPVESTAVVAGGFEVPAHLGALFLVCPNNPTAETLTPECLRDIARQCAARDVLLVIDFSFRFTSELQAWDQYAILAESGVSFACIEDTGKTWPLLDLKVGMIISDPRTQESVRAIADDYLLNVSPLVFRMLTEYIESDPSRSWLEVVDINRHELAGALSDTGAQIAEGAAPVSVAWLTLPPGWDGDELCRWLSARGVSLCPGAQFYWNAPERGRGHVRVALLRPVDYFGSAVAQLRRLLSTYQPQASAA